MELNNTQKGIIALVLGYLIYKKIIVPAGQTIGLVSVQNLNPIWTANENNKAHNLTYTLHPYDAIEIANNINNDLGLLSDNYTGIMSELQKCSTLGDVYAVCFFYYQNFKESLWQTLKNGKTSFPLSSLTIKHLQAINDFVNDLPA
jgi:hypothetical protein